MEINPDDPSETIIPKIIDPKVDNTVTPLPYQLAGHITFGEKKIPCIMLGPSGHTVLKLIQPPPKGQNEFIFYRHCKQFIDSLMAEDTATSKTKTSKLSQQSLSSPVAGAHRGPVSDSGMTSRSSASKTKYLTLLPSSKTPCYFDDDVISSHASCSASQISEAQSLEDYYYAHQSEISLQTQTQSYTRERLQSSQQWNLFESLEIDNLLIKELIENYIPKFYGTRTINGYDYLELENLGHEYVSPCLADVKIGRVTYDPTADPDKIARRTKKWPPLKKIGYSFLGIKRDQEKLLDRSFCRSLNEHQILQAFEKFLPTSNENNRVEKIVDSLVSQLDQIISWFKRQNCIQFYASSLLVTYCSRTARANLKMIDFAHVFYEVEKSDENYLYGIGNFRADLLRAKELIV